MHPSWLDSLRYDLAQMLGLGFEQSHGHVLFIATVATVPSGTLFLNLKIYFIFKNQYLELRKSKNSKTGLVGFLAMTPTRSYQ